jgi:hypothetical protein
MVYFIISGVVIGGTVLFIGNLMQDQENHDILYRKALQKERVAVRDNGNVRPGAAVPKASDVKDNPAGPSGPRALV